jgi:hypothetical protein
MDTWHSSDVIFRRLLLWSAFSVALGFKLATAQSSRQRAMGQQFVAWGGIDGAIALAGRLLIRGASAWLRTPTTQTCIAERRKKSDVYSGSTRAWMCYTYWGAPH